MNNAITYKDILDCKKWLESYKTYKPSQLDLNFEEAERNEIYFIVDRKSFYKTIQKSDKIFHVYNSTFNMMKDDEFDCLEKLEIINKKIPEDFFMELTEGE